MKKYEQGLEDKETRAVGTKNKWKWAEVIKILTNMSSRTKDKAGTVAAEIEGIKEHEQLEQKTEELEQQD